MLAIVDAGSSEKGAFAADRIRQQIRQRFGQSAAERFVPMQLHDELYTTRADLLFNGLFRDDKKVGTSAVSRRPPFCQSTQIIHSHSGASC